MNTKKLFSYTLKVSVIVQFATLAINLLVSTKNIPREYYIIKELFFCGTFYQFFVCFCGVFSNRFCVVCVFPFLGGFFLAQNLREIFSAQFFSRIFFALEKKVSY